MIIKTIGGDKLTLTDTQLTEIDHDTDHAYHVTKKDLQKALELELNTVRVHGKDWYGRKRTVAVGFYPSGDHVIGCKAFTKYTFNKILKTMGLKRN